MGTGRDRVGRRARRRRALALVCVVALAVTACESDQDPGITPTTSDGPASTSVTLGQCPPGGPDATTPPAGCLGPDGSVLRP